MCKTRCSGYDTCYQHLTNKTLLERCLKRKVAAAPHEGDASADIASPAKRNTRSRLSAPKVRPGLKTCIFCQKLERRWPSREQKYRMQSTSCCQYESAAEKLLSAANIRNDERVLVAVGDSVSSLIAREVHYHRLCFNEYTREKTLLSLQKTTSEPEQDVSQSTFLLAVKARLIDCDAATAMMVRDLVDLYSKETGIDVSNVRTDFIKRLLVQTFGNELCFVRPSRRNLAEQVFASRHEKHFVCQSVSMAVFDSDDDTEVAVSYGDGDTEAEASDGGDTSAAGSDGTDDDTEAMGGTNVHDCEMDMDELNTLYYAALILRRHMLSHAKKPTCGARSWPPTSDSGLQPEDGAKSIPDSLYKFLVWLTSAKHAEDVSQERLDISSDDLSVHRRVCSLGQDLMYSTTDVRCPKHVVLAVSLHHMFRSSSLLQILNRFGHCLPHSQVGVCCVKT